MDKVLTRKLFRKKYFEKHQPKTFNKGGLAGLQKFQKGGLTSTEKGVYAAALAGPLLAATQRPGESRFSSLARAFGAGVSTIPELAIKFSEAKKKAAPTTIRQATDAEKRMLGRNPGDRLVVKVKNDVIDSIVDKPTASEIEKRGKREAAGESAARIFSQLGPDPSTYPTGPLEGRIGRMTAFLGLNPRVARLDAELESFRKDAIQAMRGAQVGPAEEASFNKILPSITDSPTVLKAKMETAIAKLKALENRISADGVVGKKYTAEDIVREYGQDLSKFGVDVDEIVYDESLRTFEIKDGVAVEVK